MTERVKINRANSPSSILSPSVSIRSSPCPFVYHLLTVHVNRLLYPNCSFDQAAEAEAEEAAQWEAEQEEASYPSEPELPSKQVQNEDYYGNVAEERYKPEAEEWYKPEAEEQYKPEVEDEDVLYDSVEPELEPEPEPEPEPVEEQETSVSSVIEIVSGCASWVNMSSSV